MPPLKGAIYDLDGTVVDSEGLKFCSLVETLGEYGVELDRDEFMSKWVGRGPGFTEGLERHGLIVHYDDIWRRQTELYMGYIEGELELMPGLIASMEALSGRGMRLGLATGSRRVFMDATMERFGLDRHLEAAVSGSDVPANKPAPDVYEEAVRRLGLVPGECVAFEDSRAGMLSALSAGLWTVVIPNDFTVHMDLSDAHVRMGSLEDALEAVEVLEGMAGSP